ncbi:PEP-CTERM/exosortase system-associated acyltransferase [Aestuariirhabdus sp. Z084]|uniref:PEP-CTERM/exosortase system-associated acyltransferase n=1 Tax=Aestuariirhabdus haliotis TaxID=2918751 RepID=UPI00201B3AF7|nr:PEP-CTERM/exosortase system-associated acyltransferase [Aestuariirhabdus haliotis]MCL6414671.1 PEP-CTERM/exosortase system-associated acyltransferase [Aestuariirhabdus haliotis]MCL6418603.1 PEP-CTERM/exosortase system-associated acyltransferase [Aestuariirhabdus haliotis]
MENPTVCEEFNSFFRIALALTPELQSEVYKIRYDVFAREFGWEEKSPQEMESDEFDRYSVHTLIYHKKTATPAGCVRLVIPDPLDTVQMAPFEKFCAQYISKDQFDLARLDLFSYGEASRLAVPSSFRRRKDEDKSVIPFPRADKVPDNEDKRHFPHIAMGLYFAAMAIVDLANIDYVFAMMEPRLARHLKRFGVMFQKGSDVMDYHGYRALYFIPKDYLTCHLTPSMAELYQSIKETVIKELSEPISRSPISSLTKIS